MDSQRHHSHPIGSRRYVALALIGCALAAGGFFVLLQRAIDNSAWTTAIGLGIGFGVVMAVGNSVLIRGDSRQRTDRNVIFEHTIAETVGILGAAWVLASSLDHLHVNDLVWYTIGVVPYLAMVRYLTARQIRGEDPGEIFA